MRATVAILSILAVLLFSGPVLAQSEDYSGDEEYMPRGMMPRGMMGRGMMEHDDMMGPGMMRGRGYGMMGHGMMRGYGMGYGMMECSKRGFMRAIYHLPEMEAELNLSDDQVSQLKKHKNDFLKRKADWGAEIDKKRIDLENQLDNEAAASDVRNTLEAISKVKVDMKVAGYETSRKMISILKAEQKKKWEDLCCFRSQRFRGDRDD